MFELRSGALDPARIYGEWLKFARTQNCGALITFCGLVRAENEVEGLSFEIYEPLLKIWFEKWQKKLEKDEVKLMFAHSVGEVLVGESSYFTAVLSRHRKLGLRLINEFVEDFKKNAPIWKYDIIRGKKIYAKDRSQKLDGAGILA